MNEKNKPIVGEEEMKEFKSMLGNAEKLVQDDLSLDDILMEFGGSAPQSPAEVPATESPKQPVKASEPPVEFEEFTELDAENADTGTLEKIMAEVNRESIPGEHVSEELADTAPLPSVHIKPSAQSTSQKETEQLQKHIYFLLFWQCFVQVLWEYFKSFLHVRIRVKGLMNFCSWHFYLCLLYPFLEKPQYGKKQNSKRNFMFLHLLWR